MGRHFKVKTYSNNLKKFLEQRLSLKEKQKWVTKLLGYGFEIIYKRGRKLLFRIHSQEGMKMSKHFSMPFLLSNMIVSLNQGRNGRMMKRYGHSFKICNKIPVYLIHLFGKMIHCGKKIADIYVITPNLNKRFF